MVQPRRRAPLSVPQPEYHGCGDFPSKKEAPFGRSVLWAIDFRLERVDDLLGTTTLVVIWLASCSAATKSFCELLNWIRWVKGSRPPSLTSEIQGNTVRMFMSRAPWSCLSRSALSPGKWKGSQSAISKSTSSNSVSCLYWARWIGSQNPAAF